MNSPIRDSLERPYGLTPFEIPTGLMDLKAKELFGGFHKLREKPHCFGEPYSLSKS
jgi:hypothetical protein